MSSDLPHVDIEMMSELRDIMADDLNLLISAFLNDSVARLKEIKETFDSSNAAVFALACHSLKGSSANIGLLRLSELCRQAELKGKEQDLSGGKELLQEIEAEFETVSVYLHNQC